MVTPRYLCILPRVMVIFTIYPYSASISERAPDTMSVSKCHIFSSSTFQSMLHCLSLTTFLWLTSHICFSDIPCLLGFRRVFYRRSMKPIEFHRYPSWLLHTYISLRGYLCINVPFSRIGWYNQVDSPFNPPSWCVCLVFSNKLVEGLLWF